MHQLTPLLHYFPRDHVLKVPEFVPSENVSSMEKERGPQQGMATINAAIVLAQMAKDIRLPRLPVSSAQKVIV